LSKQGVYAQGYHGYADDGVVLVIGIVLPTVCEVMQRTLKGIEKWCFNHQLSVNPSKTEMVLFTRKYKIEMMKNIIFYQQELTCSKQVKYLGVILDSKLNWKVHVDAKCQKALVAFYQLRRVTGKTWGYSPKIVHWIYTMVIRPMLSYAAVVWWPRVNFSTVEKQLEHVQRIACLYITGAIRTTPTTALEIIIGLLPLAIFVRQDAISACFHLKVNKQWKYNSCGHAVINRELEEIIPETHFRSDNIITQYVFNKNYVVIIPNRSDWINNNIIVDDEIVCFTDGSRIDHTGQAGASVFIEHTTSNKNYLLENTPLYFRLKSMLYAIVYCSCAMKWTCPLLYALIVKQHSRL